MLRNAQESLAFIAPALIFMIFAFAVPVGGSVYQSFADQDTCVISLAGYQKLFASALFWKIAVNTVVIAVTATLVSLLLAYPIAYYLAQQTPRARALMMIMVLVPFWTSILVKTFAFTVLLGQGGLINQMFGALGLPTIKMLFNRTGVIIGMSHFLIPFMVFPILSSLLKQPPELRRAAEIMGSGPVRIFCRITFPLSMPGVMAGTLMVLILALGFFVAPALLGGRGDMMLASLIEYHIRETLDWQQASALSMLLILFAAAATVLLSLIPGGSNLLGGDEE